MNRLCVNGHFLHQRLTGVQRYAREILKGFDRAGYAYEMLEPPPFFSAGRPAQHMWEQLLLPQKAKGAAALWSPANSGPIRADNHIITLHDIGVFPHPEWFSKSYRLWKQTLIPRIVRQAKAVITVSEFSKKTICQYLKINQNNVRVIYNGVDTDRFKPAGTAAIQKVLERYSITRPYLLALGSIDPRKNFARLITAWNRCVKQENITGYDLVIAGGRNANFRRFRIDTSSPSVKLLGYVDDEELVPLYSGATAFLFPSLFEGFGLPVVEAMACGAAVLTSCSSALDEIAGDAAVKVSPESIESIQNGIMQLLDSPSLRHTLANRGYERIALFNWDKAAFKTHRYLMD